jgi:hypothetical protein
VEDQLLSIKLVKAVAVEAMVEQAVDTFAHVQG